MKKLLIYIYIVLVLNFTGLISMNNREKRPFDTEETSDLYNNDLVEFAQLILDSIGNLTLLRSENSEYQDATSSTSQSTQSTAKKARISYIIDPESESEEEESQRQDASSFVESSNTNATQEIMPNYTSVNVPGYGEIVPVCENDLRVFQMIVKIHEERPVSVMCSICGVRVSLNKRRHFEGHLSKKYYQCKKDPECISKTRSFASYTAHKSDTIHCPIRPKRKKCSRNTKKQSASISLPVAVSPQPTQSDDVRCHSNLLMDYLKSVSCDDVLSQRMRALQRQIEREQRNKR
jgi:hypothetical protein